MKMNETTKKSPKEVQRIVKGDLMVRGITLSEAAERIGTSQPSLSAILSREAYPGKIMAAKLAREFGYSMMFLLTGEGELFPSATGGAGETGDDWRRLVVASLESLRDALGALGARVSNLENIVGGALNADYQVVSKFFAN